jgi:hypothetical protein
MKTPCKPLLRQAVVALSLLGLALTQAQAHGPGGWRGGHHHHGGGGGYWVAPALIGGALLGAALARPAYAYPATPAPVYPVTPAFAPAVMPYGSPVMQQPVGYFCPTAGQFYPYVATCNVPWQLL